MLAYNAVDYEFESLSGQTKDYVICICCFSSQHASFMNNSKDWFMGWNQDNVSELGNMSTYRLLFQ